MWREGFDEGVSSETDPEGREVATIETLKAVYEDGKFRLLEPSRVRLNEGERVRLVIESEPEPEDILALAEGVYAGLSEEETEDVERIALDRGEFFGEREA